MPLNSAILKGTTRNARLEQAAVGPPSIKAAPPADDVDAIQRIQRALVALGHPLPRSFPSGPSGPPDGKYGTETLNAVAAFQRRVFPTQPTEWDGRVGKNTLAKMDSMLPAGAGPAPPPPPPAPPAKTMSALATDDKVTSIAWANAAIAKLTEARTLLTNPPPGPLPGFPPITPPTVLQTFAALETHFHISTATIPRADYIAQVITIFTAVLNVLTNSASFFIDDTTSAEAANGTPAHVPFGTGKVNFTPAFRKRDKSVTPPTGFGDMCRAAMVLHEPVHVVDHPAASLAVNHIHENSTQYATQPAANQLHNAHSYASFGQQAFFGRDTRFGIGRPDD